MLGIKGTVRLWYVSGITDMRFGKYRLFSEVEALGRNPYNGDGYQLYCILCGFLICFFCTFIA